MSRYYGYNVPEISGWAEDDPLTALEAAQAGADPWIYRDIPCNPGYCHPFRHCFPRHHCYPGRHASGCTPQHCHPGRHHGCTPHHHWRRCSPCCHCEQPSPHIRCCFPSSGCVPSPGCFPVQPCFPAQPCFPRSKR